MGRGMVSSCTHTLLSCDPRRRRPAWRFVARTGGRGGWLTPPWHNKNHRRTRTGTQTLVCLPTPQQQLTRERSPPVRGHPPHGGLSTQTQRKKSMDDNNNMDGPVSPRTRVLRSVASDDPAEVAAALALANADLTAFAVDGHGSTVLHAAATYGAVAVVRWAVEAGGAVDGRDAAGQTPLHLACSGGDAEMVGVLLEYRADVAATTKDRIVRLGRMPVYEPGGRTPLHYAAASGAAGVASALLAAGADAARRDLDGSTAWDVAVQEPPRPRGDVAAVLSPGTPVPDAEAARAAARGVFRERAARLTQDEVAAKLEEESSSSEEAEDAPTDPAACPLGAPPPPATAATSTHTAWTFAPRWARTPLLIDTGTNAPRAVRHAHLWRAGAADCVAAGAPFAGSAAVVMSHAAAAAIRGGGGGAPPPVPPEDAGAWVYCGHQLGRFSGQLGDGATMYLGEVVNGRGEKWELQIKGGGRTPFSRSADGRKVLRSSLREFVCSEAMYYLGVPTTRSGSLVVSKSDAVIRDIHYDGNAAPEPCAVVTRIASTFLRFGSFEICKPEDAVTGRAGPSAGLTAPLKTLIDFTVKQYFPDAKDVAEMYAEVVRSSAYLASAWQTVGFCHGVLNTDNMSIVGLTIDYGPYGFMESYDEGYICNASDGGGRYRYGAQPEIVGWNLLKLKEAIALVHPGAADALTAAHATYDATYRAYFYTRMGQKLGLVVATDADLARDASGRPVSRAVPPLPAEDVVGLVDSFVDTLADTSADYTKACRALSARVVASDADVDAALQALVAACPTKEERIRMEKGKAKVVKLEVPMQQLQMILQIPHVQQALNDPNNDDPQIEAIKDELEKFNTLKEIVSVIEAFEAQPEGKLQDAWRAKWRKWLEAYAKAPKAEGCAASMPRLNPAFIPRQWVLQTVIAAADAGDFAPLQELLERVKIPFDESPAFDAKFADASLDVRSVLVT
eukprot:TRINITY_DN9995_c0_g1_i1.p1 TRINITY_DN9995_c0_g1~~TRINITY_DN9995_c0_g1_i1.p1  ORF type:complete len:961 (+),score=298.22 TRINITY_DN9995_c0_g1_i1:20-2902(+)